MRDSFIKSGIDDCAVLIQMCLKCIFLFIRLTIYTKYVKRFFNLFHHVVKFQIIQPFSFVEYLQFLCNPAVFSFYIYDFIHPKASLFLFHRKHIVTFHGVGQVIKQQFRQSVAFGPPGRWMRESALSHCSGFQNVRIPKHSGTGTRNKGSSPPAGVR